MSEKQTCSFCGTEEPERAIQDPRTGEVICYPCIDLLSKIKQMDEERHTQEGE